MDSIKVIERIEDGSWVVDMTIGGATCTMDVKEAQILCGKLYEALKYIQRVEKQHSESLAK